MKASYKIVFDMKSCRLCDGFFIFWIHKIHKRIQTKIIMKKVISAIVTAVIVAAFFISIPVQGTALAESEQRILPVLMYHSILNSRKGTYIVSAAQLEEDIKMLTELGYTAVFPSEVTAYAEGIGDLPEKPIMISFDDGHYNNMYYGLPILQKYAAKAVINIIGAFSEYSTSSGDDSNPNYSHLTWEQISSLAASGCFEFGNHTYNMHKFKPRYGIMPKYGESEVDYRENLYSDVDRLNKLLESYCGYEATVFAYPFGKYCDSAKAILKELNFKIYLTCNEGVNVIKRGEGKELVLKRINRNGSYTVDDVIVKVKGAKSNS